MTLPPSEHPSTVIVTNSSRNQVIIEGCDPHIVRIFRGDRATQGISTQAPTRPESPDIAAIGRDMEALALKGCVVGADETPTTTSSQPRVHDRYEDFHVSNDLRVKYPPFDTGWNQGYIWVVVFRGLEVGVFYDLWCVSILRRYHCLT